MNLKSFHIKSIIRQLTLLLTISFVSNGVNAQALKSDFENYTTKDGLSQNLISCITQDKQGFIWIGTEDGLNRFDGHQFKILRHKEDDPSTIISSSIRALLVDDDGSLWIGTEKGVSRYYPKTEFIEQFPIDFTDETKLNGSFISAINKHPNGSIWISYIGSGIDIITPGDSIVFHYTIHREDAFKLKNDMISAVQFMPDGYTLIGTYSGLQALNPKGEVLSEEEAQIKYPWLKDFTVSVKQMAITDKGNTLWMGTEVNGAIRIDLAQNKLQSFNSSNSELTSNDILAITEDSKGNVWIGSDAIYKYNAQKNKVVWYNEHGMYIKNHTHSIFEDKDHNVWMGSSRLGVRKFTHQDNNITHFHSNQGEGSIKSDEILTFSQDKRGQIWVAGGGAGLMRMDPARRKFDIAGLNLKLNWLSIKSIHLDKDGYFWMGGWDTGLIKYHPQKNTFERFHPEEGTLPSRHIWDIAADKDGNIWLGTLRDGLCRFNPVTKEYKYFKHAPGDTTALANNDVLGLYVDSRNILWVATSNGLSILKPGTESFRSLLRINSKDASSLSTSVLQCMYEDAQGRIWLGTKGGGIAIVQLTNDKLVVEKIIKQKDGLPSNSITAIQADQHNNLWVSTSSGLAKISFKDFDDLDITTISDLEGFEFLPQSNLKLADGRLLFGGINGFYMFHPDKLKLTPGNAEVTFTCLSIINEEIKPNVPYDNRIILEKSITETDELILSHEDYAFTISFAPVTYNQQHNIQYAYMLENLDKDWQYTNSEKRFIHYTNLSPGTYVLKVKASFDGKTWPETSKSLKVIITPPWWASFWFRFGLIIFVLSGLYLIYKARVRFLKNQSRKLEELVIQRTCELKASNEEIQLLLGEVALQKENIENKNDELIQINEELEAQHEFLKDKREELEIAHLKLREVNSSLELLVNQRTQSLNNTVHELETFLYRASHDLRGPISSMLGLLMVSKLDGKPGLSDPMFSDLLSKSVIKLERTLQKLLQKYTIQKEEVLLEKLTKSDFLDLVNEMQQDLKYFRASDFVVEVDDLLELETDRKLLNILLLSLLENAFFFSEKCNNTKVELKVCQRNGNAIITVSDYGVGIKQELKEKIFNMFFRGSVLSNGNGLGLYLVKSALEKIDGVVKVDTEEGAYSRFTVLLHSKAKVVKTIPLLQEQKA